MAALQDAKKRREQGEALSGRDDTWERIEEGEQRREALASRSPPIDGIELTDDQRERLENLDQGGPGPGGGHDRQNPAPGGGHARSR